MDFWRFRLKSREKTKTDVSATPLFDRWVCQEAARRLSYNDRH
jgi:hypothetical protein